MEPVSTPVTADTTALYYDEDLKTALEEFVNSGATDVPPQVAQIIKNISKTGIPCYSWDHLKKVLYIRIKDVLTEFHSSCPDCPVTPENNFQSQLQRILQALNLFSGPPFTIQRLCELTVMPHKLYNSTKKLLAAFEKSLSVSSTVPADEMVRALQSVGLDAAKLGVLPAAVEMDISEPMVL
eukprot:GILK01003309.1.p1 GENE.GILK01003309.1~~GILK01003309.1.p1  ORF type:complete len:182 (+),score=14.06 GILK01003309.1:97-642(+)